MMNIILTILLTALAIAIPPKSHLQHIKKYSQSYTVTRNSPWGPVWIKNHYAGEPITEPNHLDVVLICMSKRKQAKPLLANYTHCGLEDVSFDAEKKLISLHLLDADPKTGLCLKRRIKSLSVPCP